MSKKATEFQKREMSKMYRGKEIFKPLNTGWLDERVACVREWVANIFFYRKGDTTIMIDAGYNYDRLAEKIGWLGIDPQSIRHILITHQDTDHVGAVEADSPGLFRSAKLYIGEIENRYLTGEVRRKVIYHLYKLPQVTINNEKVLLHDGETFEIDGIKIECFLVPGHTWGHMVYLIDDKYLFTGDTLWFGADGGYSFISSLAESNKLAVKSLAALEQKLQSRGLHPLFLTGHTGWTDNFEFAFAHKDKLCSPFRKRVPAPTAPYDRALCGAIRRARYQAHLRRLDPTDTGQMEGGGQSILVPTGRGSVLYGGQEYDRYGACYRRDGYSARRRDRLFLYCRQRRGLHDAGSAHTRGRTHGARLRRGQDAGGAGRLVPGVPLCRAATGSRAGAVAEHAGALYPSGHAPVREGVRDGRRGEGRGAALAGRNDAQEADAQVPYQTLQIGRAHV